MNPMYGREPLAALEFLADAQLPHPLDYVVLLHCALAHADGVHLSVHDTWQCLRQRGVRAGNNGAGQLGRDSVYNSFNRLIEAGYLIRSRDRVHGSFGPVEYRLSVEAIEGLGVDR